MHKFSSLLNITLHVSDGLSVHHQEFKTVHTASGICHIKILKMGKITIELLIMDGKTESCRVIFNKLEKLCS